MADTQLKLGSFVFADMEIPEKVPFGGRQSLAAHDMIGGGRVVDAMGAFEESITWSGLFRGPQAMARASELDQFRIAGKPLPLTWWDRRFTVVIETFKADFQRFYLVPYSITCMVVKNEARTPGAATGPSADSQIRADMATASGLATTVNDGGLTATMTTLQSAVSSVSDFAKATQTTINGVLQPLAAVQAQVKTLIASTGNLLTNVATVGGVLPNNPIARQVAALNGQVAAMSSAPALYNLQAVLGRMGSNLAAAPGATKIVTTAGGSLFSIAAQQYGDATAWSKIAAANNTTDPQISGLATMKIPPAASGVVGGVLNG